MSDHFQQAVKPRQSLKFYHKKNHNLPESVLCLQVCQMLKPPTCLAIESIWEDESDCIESNRSNWGGWVTSTEKLGNHEPYREPENM